jgi:molybdenum cofactor synthesis domain-containing protein
VKNLTCDVEILSVGNELLIGKIVNTNAQWLAKEATSLGTIVKRITVLPDNIDETAEAINETLKRKPQFVLITGGLGPTFDDKTLETIAKALKRRLKVNKEALRMVEEKYRLYTAKTGNNVELTSPRIKMATFPENSTPLCNPVGTAPAMRIDIEGTIIVALPGVPKEMEGIFQDTIKPLLKQCSHGNVFFEQSIYANDIMESVLAPLIDETMREYPEIYIKSHPKGEEKTPHIEIHFSRMAIEQQKETRLKEAVGHLSRLIEKNNGKILPKQEII